MTCHPTPHTEVLCKKPCARKRDCGHACKRLCYQDCGPCNENVTKTLPSCQHKLDMPCATDPATVFCQAKYVSLTCIIRMFTLSLSLSLFLSLSHSLSSFDCRCTRQLPCGHQCTGKCGVTPCQPCKVKLQKVLPCKHLQKYSCSQPPPTTCKFPCGTTLPCGHRCQGSWYVIIFPFLIFSINISPPPAT